VQVWDNLAQCVSQIRYKYPDTPLILGGDFNCPGIDWSTGNLTESYLPAHFREFLLEFVQDFLLEQIVLNPTRGNNILDLCFTSHPDSINQCKTVTGFSDHDTAIVEMLYNIPINKKPKKQTYCYNRADWDGLCEEVTEISRYYFERNVNTTKSVEENWNYIRDKSYRHVKLGIMLLGLHHNSKG